MRQEVRHAGQWPLYVPMSMPGDPVFKMGLENMLRVMATVQAVHRLRILQIGGDQPTFPAIGTNKLDLYNAWGVRVEVGSNLTLVDKVRERLSDPPSWLDEAVSGLFQGVDVTEAVEFDPNVPKTAALLLYGMLEMIQEKKCAAATARCWSEVLTALKTMMCFDLGQLNDWDLPTACETDIYGTISMVMLAAASLGENKPFFLDNTITLENGDICFWHCGPICRSCWREGCEAKLREGWILQEPGAGYIHVPCLEIGDTVTLCRVSTDMNGALVTVTHEAKVVDGPDTRGTYFYIRVKDWPAYERELMNAPVVHHWALVRGSYMHSIHQAAGLLGMRCTVLNDGLDEINARIECRAARG